MSEVRAADRRARRASLATGRRSGPGARSPFVARGLAAGLGVATVALAAGPAAHALPPGGAVDKPGTPAGTLEITNPAGLREGKVQFCVRNFVTRDGAAPQQFMVKFDDFGSRGIGPFQPDASGTYCGEIATDRAAYASAASADDKIPATANGAAANLCDAGSSHWLRVLSGSWAHPNASERSLARDFTIDATCGTGGKAALPSVGTVVGGDAGVGTQPAPGTGGGTGDGSGGGSGTGSGTGTTGGGTTTTPGSGGTTTTAPVVLSGLAKLRSRTLRFDRTRLTLPLRRTGAVGGGKITVRTVSKIGGAGVSPRIRTLVSGRRYTLGGTTTQTVRLALTPHTGRSVLRNRTRLAANVTITPTGGTPTTTRVVLRATKTTTTK